jgi:hypothetical protein
MRKEEFNRNKSGGRYSLLPAELKRELEESVISTLGIIKVIEYKAFNKSK